MSRPSDGGSLPPLESNSNRTCSRSLHGGHASSIASATAGSAPSLTNQAALASILYSHPPTHHARDLITAQPATNSCHAINTTHAHLSMHNTHNSERPPVWREHVVRELSVRTCLVPYVPPVPARSCRAALGLPRTSRQPRLEPPPAAWRPTRCALSTITTLQSYLCTYLTT